MAHMPTAHVPHSPPPNRHHDPPPQPSFARKRRILALCAIALAVFCIYGWTVWPLSAAIELSYFDVITSDTSVELLWGTNAEYNLIRFQILCKEAREPDTAYHPIGQLPARGGPETEAAYNFAISTGLDFGVPYCFRIEEITSDGSPGDIFERCGYGLSVTPTPTPLTGTVTGTISATVTATTPITSADLLSGTLAPVPTATETATFTPIPFETPTPTAVSISPLEGASPFESPLPGEADGASVEDQQPPLETPTWTPTWMPEFTPTETLMPTDMPTDMPGEEDTSDGSTAANREPGPAYIVVTATPTMELTQLEFAFTPLPTTTPVPQTPLLATILVPTTENLLVMLLCFIFFSASGFGLLGIITSALYMRSRQRRRPRNFYRS